MNTETEEKAPEIASETEAKQIEPALAKPAVYTFRHLSGRFREWGWNRLDQIHKAAKDAARELSPELAFEITDNLGEFMRRYWTLCRLTTHGAGDDVAFCDHKGVLSVHSFRDICKSVRGRSIKSNPIDEHQLFQAAIKDGKPLYIPAMFGKKIPNVVSMGGDAVHGCEKLASHRLGGCFAADALLVRMAVLSRLHNTDVYIPYDFNLN